MFQTNVNTSKIRNISQRHEISTHARTIATVPGHSSGFLAGMMFARLFRFSNETILAACYSFSSMLISLSICSNIDLLHVYIVPDAVVIVDKEGHKQK